METNTIITLALFIVFCIILYAVNNNRKKAKKAKYRNKIFALAEQNSCQISEYEIWNNSVIGIDIVRNCVFVVRNSKDNETSQKIDLAEFQKCSVNESSRIVSTKESSRKVVDRIELVFSNATGKKPDTIIEFYNTAHDNLFLAGEHQLAEKWCKIVNDIIAASVKMK
jgi:hypothetical protein